MIFSGFAHGCRFNRRGFFPFFHYGYVLLAWRFRRGHYLSEAAFTFYSLHCSDGSFPFHPLAFPFFTILFFSFLFFSFLFQFPFSSPFPFLSLFLSFSSLFSFPFPFLAFSFPFLPSPLFFLPFFSPLFLLALGAGRGGAFL